MSPNTLKILTWNISYAYGLGSEGKSAWGYAYHQKSRQHFELVLNSMGDLIRRLGVDVVFLQEVDFDSSRSHGLNQLEWISRRSGLLYRDSVESWRHPYVPYPGIHPKNQFRSIRSGGGILSRYPLNPVQTDLLPKPRENPKWYNSFYLNRYLQMVEIQTPQPIRLLNCHLEAFSEDNRSLHLLKLSERLVDYEVELAGGDWNGSADLHPRAQSGWSVLPAPQPTFPSHRPELKLDGYILKKNRFKIEEISVLDTGTLSDHRPVYLTLGGT